MKTVARRHRLLTFLYGDGADAVGREVDALLDEHGLQKPGRGGWSERDAWLITYADQFQQPGGRPLQTLGAFFGRHLTPWLNGFHILPLFPSSSDDGVTNQLVEEVAACIGDPGLYAEAAENNYEVGRNHFSYDVLRERVLPLFAHLD
jgi:hypothetical protein